MAEGTEALVAPAPTQGLIPNQVRELFSSSSAGRGETLPGSLDKNDGHSTWLDHPVRGSLVWRLLPWL